MTDDTDAIADRIAELHNPEPEPEIPAYMLNQLTRADLEHMTPAQIVEASEAGRFAHMLGQLIPHDIELIQKATDNRALTVAEARRLHEIGRSDLVATYSHDRITKD